MIPRRKNNSASRNRQRRRGQALVEFIIIYPTLLLLVLGAFQFALVYQAKTTLNYATFMAARQGALKNAKTNPMKDALAAGMTPLFTTTKDDYLDLVKARAIAAIEAFNPLNTRIRVISPTADAYNAHKGDSESGTEIPNDNLMYRPTTVKGGMSVQDANLLTIEVTYCTRLIVPIVNRVIYSLYFGFVGEQVLAAEYYSGAATPSGLAGQRCADINDQIDSLINQLASYVPGGSGFLSSFSFPEIPTTIPGLDWNVGGYRIPITSTATVRMQSPVTQAP
ncbi:MAG: pilus assembly protein [Burkholderiales bacterium]|nr:pilus assembly protein [Burkholderiales bacterium]